MKMKIELTADELMNVVDATMDEAIDRGYGDDEETVDDMLHIVDAALSAMGIEIIEEEEEEEDDDDFEEDDFDDDDDDDENEYWEKYPGIKNCLVEQDGQMYLTQSDAMDFLSIIKEMVEETMEDASPEEKYEMMCEAWIQMGKDFGIAGVLLGE